MSQNGKLMPNLDQHSTKLLNLTVLQRIHTFVEEILITAAYVSFYEFNIDLSQWSRKAVEGCKIQATVRKTMIYKFKQLLSEGRVYVMKLFSVVPNQGSYRATRHQFKLIFQFRTTVRDAICDFIPKSALTISPFIELLETKEDSDFLVDVVGLLVSVSEEKEYDKDGKKMKMAVMELAENDHRIRCALFGEHVDELNRFLSSGYAEQPIVVLHLAKVKFFRGRVGLQNVMFGSKLGFNLDIPEVAAFRKSSIPHGVSASQPIGIVGSGKNIGIEEDFMKLTPRCTVKSLDDNNRAGTFVVLAKIAEIVEDGPWWYSACVCGRGVQAEFGIYFCQFCNIHVTNVTPRFRVKVLVEDSTGVSIFVLFDREASYLLNKTCAQLFE
ncbi:replication protein A 70 kDa DNA-binding subunit B isoform X2 [Arachis duranensis]|uniref:Replication protein A 70 kDa DNA-binding subunit B isoform X2 n=1 Tax=Arachis duranensis TaxID=130453 RepID=A0A6P5NA78_ARADU|nr:replication protein A 70 kDa DNA-binding subunit B isoform X2 [Arachis duranensis]